MKSIIILFGIGCIFMLSSCNSCASTNDKLLNGIDNLIGKVDRFLEEHKAVAKPQPPIDYEKEGVNTKHLFIFTDTTMTYNGKSFMPGMTIGELCEIFGQYERLAEPGIFIAKKNALLGNKRLVGYTIGAIIILTIPTLLGFLDYGFMPKKCH